MNMLVTEFHHCFFHNLFRLCKHNIYENYLIQLTSAPEVAEELSLCGQTSVLTINEHHSEKYQESQRTHL